MVIDGCESHRTMPSPEETAAARSASLFAPSRREHYEQGVATAKLANSEMSAKEPGIV
jgi:hypothetical protein